MVRTLLFPTAYLSTRAWFTGTTFVTSWLTHGLASSYLEGCNFLTVAVSTPANSMGHSLLLHSILAVIGFCFRQFEIASLVSISMNLLRTLVYLVISTSAHVFLLRFTSSDNARTASNGPN